MPGFSTSTASKKFEVQMHELLQAQDLNGATALMGGIGNFRWNLALDRLDFCSEEYARIFGLNPQDLISSLDSRAKAFAQIDPADQKAYARAIDNLDKQQLHHVEYRIVRDDGSIRHVSELGVLNSDDSGDSREIIGLLQDVTEQKTLERNLREARGALESIVVDRTRELADTVARLKLEMAEREKVAIELENRNAELERFAYTVSHELKTPLVTIKGFIGLLDKDIAGSDWQRVETDLQRISSAADTMAELLSELLEPARIGQVMNETVSCNLAEVAREAIELIEIDYDRQAVEIDIADMPAVDGDRNRLLEVYVNLIENALKFMGDQQSPRISIGSTDKDEMIQCFVQDNGIGIAANHTDLIFGLFERLDANIEGIGVGLALVRRIIQVHGGEIWVESKGISQGSRFLFTLPGPRSSGGPGRE